MEFWRRPGFTTSEKGGSYRPIDQQTSLLSDPTPSNEIEHNEELHFHTMIPAENWSQSAVRKWLELHFQYQCSIEEEEARELACRFVGYGSVLYHMESEHYLLMFGGDQRVLSVWATVEEYRKVEAKGRKKGNLEAEKLERRRELAARRYEEAWYHSMHLRRYAGVV
ncbi:hypothetical protein VTL71DRAFT_875 [Oculimacula yallundae]|uniref:Uncharacterized protein n=1 Tax=Oculimacula yallundae TaxID=86028 RepID=A0ABR4D283_9HELO